MIEIYHKHRLIARSERDIPVKRIARAAHVRGLPGLTVVSTHGTTYVPATED